MMCQVNTIWLILLILSVNLYAIIWLLRGTEGYGATQSVVLI